MTCAAARLTDAGGIQLDPIREPPDDAKPFSRASACPNQAGRIRVGTGSAPIAQKHSPLGCRIAMVVAIAMVLTTQWPASNALFKPPGPPADTSHPLIPDPAASTASCGPRRCTDVDALWSQPFAAIWDVFDKVGFPMGTDAWTWPGTDAFISKSLSISCAPAASHRSAATWWGRAAVCRQRRDCS